jgi:hypothetical protein
VKDKDSLPRNRSTRRHGGLAPSVLRKVGGKALAEGRGNSVRLTPLGLWVNRIYQGALLRALGEKYFLEDERDAVDIEKLYRLYRWVQETLKALKKAGCTLTRQDGKPVTFEWIARLFYLSEIERWKSLDFEPTRTAELALGRSIGLSLKLASEVEAWTPEAVSILECPRFESPLHQLLFCVANLANGRFDAGPKAKAVADEALRGYDLLQRAANQQVNLYRFSG